MKQKSVTEGTNDTERRRPRASVKETQTALEAVDRDTSGVSAMTFPGVEADAGLLVRETKRQFSQVMHELEVLSGQPSEIAFARATLPASDGNVERIQATAPEDMKWGLITMLMHRDPALAVAEWERIKTAALAKVQSGYAAAEVLGLSSRSPYELALFLSVRETLRQDWQPQNGIEILLIDKMAQAYTLQMRWMNRLVKMSEDDGWMDDILAEPSQPEKKRRTKSAQGETSDRWQAPRVSQAKAMEIAAQEVDRFDRMFVRLVRNLRDIRRFLPTPVPTPPSVTINNPAQVNLGQQQINVNGEIEQPLPTLPSV